MKRDQRESADVCVLLVLTAAGLKQTIALARTRKRRIAKVVAAAAKASMSAEM